MVEVIYKNEHWGIYDDKKNMFYPNQAYKNTLNTILNSINPDEYYHICLKYSSTFKEVYATAYTSIETEPVVNTLLFVGNGKIIYINDSGQTVKDFYKWKLNRDSDKIYTSEEVKKISEESYIKGADAVLHKRKKIKQ